MEIFAPLKKDAYKIGHKDQYAPGTTMVYSNLTARSGKHSNVPNGKGVVFVGLQFVIIDTLINNWDNTFFDKRKEAVIPKYQSAVEKVLGSTVSVDHMADLHDLGYLPVEVRALPEGSFVPYGVPMLTIHNTHPDFFWVTNMLETMLSAELWHMITSATVANEYRKGFLKYAEETGAALDGVPFQAHDFSMRGMSGCVAAAMSGFAALAVGSYGTDSLPAIQLAEEYYSAGSNEVVGMSVNATEHSVMCSNTKESEINTFKRLISETYPSGIVSIVSDTWDFWKVVTEFLPVLKEDILSREGKVVIRPDSGDPVKIICGDSSSAEGTPEHKGLVECLWETFGGTINSLGYKVLDEHIGAIYGDSITLERQSLILSILKDKGFCSSNIVLGIGSYTFQHVTRDTHGMAVKSTYVEIEGVGREIFKDPKTDDGTKKSAKGLLQVVSYKDGELLELRDQVTWKQASTGALKTVFKDGVLLQETSLASIRSRVNKVCI